MDGRAGYVVTGALALLLAALSVGATGCAGNLGCRSPLHHPTMTNDDIAFGAEARVHTLSEAATGRLGTAVNLADGF